MLSRALDIGKREKFNFTFLCFLEEMRGKTECNLPLQEDLTYDEISGFTGVRNLL